MKTKGFGRGALAAATVAIGMCAMSAHAAPLVSVIDFDSQAEFDNNFTAFGNLGWRIADDAGYGDGGYAGSQANGHTSMVYDTDDAPGGAGDVFDAASGFVMDVDARISAASRGVGFLFLGTSATNRDAKHWMQFTIDRTNSPNVGSDTVGFYYNRDMDSNAGVTVATGSPLFFDTAASVNEWFHLRLAVELVNAGTQVKATLSVYNSQTLFDATTLMASHAFTFLAAESLVTASEVGLSSYSSTTAESALDNFAVYSLGEAPVNLNTPAIPEPASLGLLVIAATPWRRRR
jgi:hypothetical protein